MVVLISFSGSASGEDGEVLTPLMIAAKNGNVGAVRALTVLPVGVNAQTISMEFRLHGTPLHDRTALMFAAQEGHTEVVQILLERGADPNLKGSNGDSAWMYAVDAHHLKILVLLWPKLNMQNRSGEADLALHVAAAAGYLDIVEFLLDKVSNAKALSRALTEAAGSGQLETAKFLVEHGTAITGEVLSRVVQYTTPAKLAVLQYLLDNGADPNARYTQEGVGISGMSPLMLASYLNYYPAALDVMSLLIAYGADQDAKDEQGMAALDIARDHNQLDGIRFLKTAYEYIAGSVIDADSGKPVKGAVVSLDFLVRHSLVDQSGEKQQIKLIQQTLTDANGYFFLHTWQNPLRRKAGWELVPKQKLPLKIYVQGYQRLIAEGHFAGKKNNLIAEQTHKLKPLQSNSGALVQELEILKQELTPEVFADFLDRREPGDQEVRRDGQKHLTLLFGSICETLSDKTRGQVCYLPCSTVDKLIQKYKFEVDWEKERKQAVANAARDGVTLKPLIVLNTGCGYKIISSDGKSVQSIGGSPGGIVVGAPAQLSGGQPSVQVRGK